MNPKFRKGLSVLLLALLLICGYFLIRNLMSYQTGDAAAADARALVTTEDKLPDRKDRVEETIPTELRTVWIPAPIEEEDPVFHEMAEMDLTSLQQENSDVLGWIRISDTAVDYPLLQGTDNEFYLTRNWRGAKEYLGSIFLESYNSPDLTDFNTIIYGHNMANGSMFGSLRQFRFKGHLEKHPYVYILSADGVLRYDIFSTYIAEVDSNTYRLSFQETEDREQFIDMALQASQIDAGITPAATDRILTLSTCSGMGYSTRRVVHARLKMVEVAP